jgi:Type III restriction enzyme, res subunit
MQQRVLNITVEDWIKIPAAGLAPLVDRRINERLVFTNPDYELRHSRGEWIGSIPPQINCIRRTSGQLLLPRGFLDQFLEILKKADQPFRMVDHRRLLEPVPIEFYGQLKEYQQEAAEAVLEKDFATLVGGPKSGKTIVAVYSIAQRRQPTLILVPNLGLVDGWLTKIQNFLQIPTSEVGLIVNGTKRIGKVITLAHTGEIIRHWRHIRDHIGYLILDECQRCPSRTFTQLLPNFDTRYMLGLTTSTQRRDRLSRLMYYYVGDIVYTINERDAREGRGIIQAQVVGRVTDFQYDYSSRADFNPMLSALMTDAPRTHQIVNDIVAEMEQNPQPILVLTGGAPQNDVLKAALEAHGIEVISLDWKQEQLDSEDDDDEELQPLQIPVLGDAPVVVLVTSDVLLRYSRNLPVKILVLAIPAYFRGRMAHAIRNLYHGSGGNGPEKLKIYDYVDRNIALLENFFRMRSYNYGVHPDMLINTR